MDDKRRKMRKKRIDNIKEFVTTEKKLLVQLEAMERVYMVPMKEKFPMQCDQLFDGIDFIKGASEGIINALVSVTEKDKKPVIGELTDDNCMKARMGIFLRDTLIRFVSCYKVFFRHAEKSLSYLNQLKEKDPFYKWLEDTRWHSSSIHSEQISLIDYLDRVLKRPGRVDLLIKMILDNTLESDPDYPILKEQYPKLKKLLLDLDLLIEPRQNAELMDLLSKIDPPTEILEAARQFIKQEIFMCLVGTGDGVNEQRMQFVLFDDLLLYGVLEGGMYRLRGRFYLMDSTVELEEDVIIMQDAEKCIYFFESEGGGYNGSVVSMWYKMIESSIRSTKKRHHICDVCNGNCEIVSEDEVMTKNTITTDRESGPANAVRGTSQAVLCRGCGRVICSKCMIDMVADPRDNAEDRTLYCLHCRNNERLTWEKPMSEYSIELSSVNSRWKHAISKQEGKEFFYDADSKEVSWIKPSDDAKLSKSSYCNPRNSYWLSYDTPDGKTYSWGVSSNQVQWKQTMNSTTGGKMGRFCPHCGFSSKTWSVTCTKCGCRWSL